MGCTHQNGRNSDISSAVVLPDGHLAGNRNGHDYTTDALYELFYRSGITLYNSCNKHLKPKSDGSSVCMTGFETLGPARIKRPQLIPRYLRDKHIFHAGITGSDCIFDGFTGKTRPAFYIDGEPNPALLDFDGHEEEAREFLDKNGMELVLSLPLRPTLTGFAFPVEEEWSSYIWNGTKRTVETLEDVRRFADYHLERYGHNAIVGTEYPRYAKRLLSAMKIRQFYDIESSPGSTETLLRDVADTVLETVERGTALKSENARLIHPVVSLQYPMLIMRKDAPESVKEGVHSLAYKLQSGLDKMKFANPAAFRIKLDYDLVGWGNRFRLPKDLDKMRAAKY